MFRFFPLVFFMLLSLVMTYRGSENHGFEIQVLIDGIPVPEYFHNGTRYIEAIYGKEYAVRVTNPLNTRVAVALSVDGLNIIDAQHTAAFSAKKWVLGPYESVTLSGWQTSAQHARRFFFTTEKKSYGSQLGRKENLGIIGAVFFKERPPRMEILPGTPPSAPQPRSSSSREQRKESMSADEASVSKPKSDEYAATGIGKKVRNDIQWVQMDLDPSPAARLDLRYEFREGLTQLGIFPLPLSDDPLGRRQRARGFRGIEYCPEPQ